MYNITSISCRNFMSFSELNLSLQDKCYIVQGKNDDNQGQKSNGSGKTSLLDIIAVTLLGQSLTDRDLKKCVNRYVLGTSFTTCITLQNTTSTVVISRTVYSNTKGQELQVTSNGKPIEGVPTKNGVENGLDIKAGNAWILNDLLGISKEDLLNYFLISPSTYKGFLNSNNQEKIAVISRFSNATIIDRTIADLTLNVKRGQRIIVEQEQQLANIEGQIQGLQYSVSEEAKVKFEQNKQNRIDALLPRIEKLDQQLAQVEKEGSRIAYDLSQCEEFYGHLLKDEQIKELHKNISELGSLKHDVSSLIALTQNQLRGKITCPSCSHQFILDTTESIEQLNQTLTGSISDLVSIESEYKDIKDTLDGNAMLNDLYNQTQRLSEQQQSLEQTLQSIAEQIQSIEEEQFVSEDLTDKINQLDDEKELIKQLIQGNSDNVDNDTLWIERFERFKYFLINKPISLICHLTNNILRQIGSDYTIGIEGFKKLKSGELRAELTPIVYIRGLEGESYLSFSAGERTRLDLACDLAIQQLINSTSKGGLNYYQSDEVVSSLDSAGIESVAKTFSCLNKTLMLVSHSGSDLNYDNTIVINKVNKNSVII